MSDFLFVEATDKPGPGVAARVVKTEEKPLVLDPATVVGTVYVLIVKAGVSGMTVAQLRERSNISDAMIHTALKSLETGWNYVRCVERDGVTVWVDSRTTQPPEAR